jgi:hypothetical protein
MEIKMLSIQKQMRNVAAVGVTSIALGVCGIQGAANALGVNTFNEFDAWKNAVTGFPIVEERFQNNIPSAISIQFDSGIVSTNSVSGFNSFPGLGNVDNRVNTTFGFGQYTNCVDSGGFYCSQEFTWKFPQPVVGFGFNIASADVGRLAIRGDFGDGEQTVNVAETIDPNATITVDGFFGITGSKPFDSVTFFSRVSNDFINIDSLGTSNPPVVFARSEQPIPEPTSTLSFLALGTLGAASTLKRKLKKSKSTEKDTTKVG